MYIRAMSMLIFSWVSSRIFPDDEERRSSRLSARSMAMFLYLPDWCSCLVWRKSNSFFNIS